ncbi:MAG: VanW family protein [Clostridia bacterium]|nr:VanW family protein [Clostridia bacterium]
MPARKKSAGGADVFEAYEAAHRRGKGKKSAKKRAAGSRKKKRKSAWWAWPVSIVMIVVLAGLGVAALHEKQQYEQFTLMRSAVDVSGYYPGVRIEGRDVAGRSYNEVLAELAAEDQIIRDSLSLTLVCGNRTWNVTAEELDYTSDYERVAQEAWQAGHEGNIQQRYQAIRRVQQGGADYVVTRGYDDTLLRAITDSIAAELSVPATEAQIASFNKDSLKFTISESGTGSYVDSDQLYRNALAAIQSGAAGQTVFISQQTIQPKETAESLSQKVGLMASAQTKVEGNRNRRSNIKTAMGTLNGRRVEPGEVFSFNGAIGERTEAAGYKMAGAFIDGLRTEELGGGICQVSTTLFNAVAKADLELIARSPHSRPVGYVDKGKDAAVSWPNQDFKFQNDTPYPVFILASYDDETRVCAVAIYGLKLEGGVTITIEAQVIEEIEPGDPIYVYTKELEPGVQELVEEARMGYRCESYKVYHNADGEEISRELYCRSSYPASGARYRVGQ